MDIRTWFLLQERPPTPEFRAEIPRWIEQYAPHSAYRCHEVMCVFHAGFRCGFKLIDKNGQPTDALRIMVWKMGAQLCQADGLAKVEQRHFTHHENGRVDSVFKDRWFIRGISARLRNDVIYHSQGSGYGEYGGIYWKMFKTYGHLGLLHKDRATYYEGAEKLRTHLFLAACPPDWELSDDVYCGLYRWFGYHVRRHAYDGYHDLAEIERRAAANGIGVKTGDGHAGVVSA